jgi:hypothetical protein
MKYKFLNYDEIHAAVQNADAYWDGWTAVFLNRKKDGYASPHGLFRNGKWITTFRSKPNSAGLWKIPVGINVDTK